MKVGAVNGLSGNDPENGRVSARMDRRGSVLFHKPEYGDDGGDIRCVACYECMVTVMASRR